MINTQLITEYLNDFKNAWAPSTLSSEEARLNSIIHVLDGNPESLLSHLSHLKPYSKKTYFIRASHFWQWLIEEGHISDPINPYTRFRKRNARVFKHVYARSFPEFSYREAENRIHSIRQEHVRRAAEGLLSGGLRSCEIKNGCPSGVIGKGGKPRSIYSEKVWNSLNYFRKPSYQALYRALKKVGLKPHDLRKIAANRFREKGLTEEELCQVMGWSSFSTAKSYLKPKTDEEIRKKLEDASKK